MAEDRECLFCRIASGDLDADVLLENEHVVAFRDINPQAPLHALVIPRRHIATLNDLTPGDADTLGHMYLAAQALARREGVADDGYRTVVNCNSRAGQTVFHVHLHLLAGRRMTWPPG
jgi:histidine triad (HIT) family protein